MEQVATFIKDLDHFTGHAALYRLSPPLLQDSWHDDESGTAYEYVAVSATIAPFSGPETYIFGASEDGEVLDWGELHGSYKGGLSHEEALNRAGYEVAKQVLVEFDEDDTEDFDD
jgi:hypothetical protein